MVESRRVGTACRPVPVAGGHQLAFLLAFAAMGIVLAPSARGQSSGAARRARPHPPTAATAPRVDGRRDTVYLPPASVQRMEIKAEPCVRQRVRGR